jgi:IclR family acetate operon transcriptional repressor
MRAVVNVLRIFERVSVLQPVGVSDLARDLELPKSTVQRGLTDLHAVGWIQPEGPSSRRWVQSVKMMTLVNYASGLGIREVARPAMQALLAEMDENIQLSVRNGEWMITFDRCEASRHVRAVGYVGERAPVHASSPGKAVLAWSSSSEVDELLTGPLRRYTEHTLVDYERLRRELAEARRRGYAVNWGEWREDIRGVAVPVLSTSGAPVAAISVAMPAHRLPRSRVAALGELIRSEVDKVIIPELGGDSGHTQQ